MSALILCPAHFLDCVLSSPQLYHLPVLHPQSYALSPNQPTRTESWPQKLHKSILSEEMKLQIVVMILSENPQGRIF